MGRWSPIRPITLRVLIGSLLIWGTIFLQYQKQARVANVSTPNSAQQTIRQQLQKKYTHPLIEWQQALTNRPYREENMHMLVDLNLTSTLQQSGSVNKIPPLSWSLEVDQKLWLRGESWSWIFLFSGNFLLAPDSIISWAAVESGTTDSESNTIVTLSGQMQFLWSGNTTWRYLEDITQSWALQEFLLITRAFLQEYEDTWIMQKNSPSTWWIRDLQTFSIYEKLTHQIDQHLITSASWTTQLLIDGPERWIDALLDTDWLLSATFRFPEFGLRSSLLEQQDETYDFSLTHYRVSTPLLTWSLSFTPSRKMLMSVWNRWWSRKEQLFYSGTHQFTVHPIPVFTITPPTQFRDREEIKTSRTKQSLKK